MNRKCYCCHFLTVYWSFVALFKGQFQNRIFVNLTTVLYSTCFRYRCAASLILTSTVLGVTQVTIGIGQKRVRSFNDLVLLVYERPFVTGGPCTCRPVLFTRSSKDKERDDGIVDLSWKTVKFKQQIEFQSFKFIQDFKNVHMWRFFFCLVYSRLKHCNANDA